MRTRRELDRLFEIVTNAVLATDASDESKTACVHALIKQLCDLGWDADRLDMYIGDPIVIAASQHLDRTFWCGHEKHWAAGNWSWCDLEFGHDGDHWDEEKRSWTS